jgi:excinuclease ABC subunit C
VHRTRSHIDTSHLQELVGKHDSDIVVTATGEYLVVNLHPGKINASSHSKNFRGSDIGSVYSDVTKLFQRIRDESHRFAVSYHTTLKRTKQTTSALEDIPGIGPATRRALIRKFGSVRALRSVDQAAIAEVVGPVKAATIVQYLSSQ